MKKIILAIVMFISLSTYSQVYINGKKVAESGASDVSVINGEVYIDGQPIDQYTEEIAEEIEKWDGEQPEAEPTKDPNLYETKNVDAYNKWYNVKGKKMIEERNKKTKNVFLWIAGILGGGILAITLGFVIAEIKLRIKKRKSQSVYFDNAEQRLKPKKEYPPKPNWSDTLSHDMSLPEVESPIKNRNR
jgi:hypothetical protein